MQTFHSPQLTPGGDFDPTVRQESAAHRVPEIPPSTGITVPVTKAPAREARKMAIPAISSCEPVRLSGTISVIAAPARSRVARIIRLWKGPGATALTVIWIEHPIPARLGKFRVGRTPFGAGVVDEDLEAILHPIPLLPPVTRATLPAIENKSAMLEVSPKA
jgi:hypothetical protein